MEELNNSKHFVDVPNTAAPPVESHDIVEASFDECVKRIADILKKDADMYKGYLNGCVFNQRVQKSSYVLELIINNYFNAIKDTLKDTASKEELTLKTNQLNAVKESLLVQIKLLDEFDFKLDVKLISCILYGVLQVQVENYINHD